MTKTVTLGEICKISKGRKHTEVEYSEATQRYVQIEDLTHNNNPKFTLEKGVSVNVDDLIIAWDGANAGKVGVGLNGVIGSTLARLRVENMPVESAYLFHYLDSKFDVIKSQRTGATIPHVNGGELRNMPIPLPSPPEQRRIAALLDRADALRQKDRQLLAHYDKLAQSIFLDLFGDPVKNEKGWEKAQIRDLVREVKYGTSKPAEEVGNYVYLRMNNITYEGHWNFSDLKYINLTKGEEPKYLLQKGDLVFNRTNSKELVGKTAVYQLAEPMAIAGYLIRSRTNEKAEPEYISAYLNSKHGKATLKGMCKNIIGMANINAQEFQNIGILRPPLSLQTHFARAMEQIEQQKAVVRQQLVASEGLFARLLQESFG